MRQLTIKQESWSLRQSFNIARGSKTSAEIIHVTIAENECVGHGECVPYARYGESLNSVAEQINSIRTEIESGLSTSQLCKKMPAGAARNALDCALWDLECQIEGTSAWSRAGQSPKSDLVTAFTISLDTPENMAASARDATTYPLLKIKLGGKDDLDSNRIESVRKACPHARLIVDANEGWRENNLLDLLDTCKKNKIELVEQPLPANDDTLLTAIPHAVPICADESVHTTLKLDDLKKRYDWVNIKLDKTGGLTEGLNMLAAAKTLGYGVMVGCMVGTSLAMAPALILANQADLIDLDGPLWLDKDRLKGISYENGQILTPQSSLWGNSSK